MAMLYPTLFDFAGLRLATRALISAQSVDSSIGLHISNHANAFSERSREKARGEYKRKSEYLYY